MTDRHERRMRQLDKFAAGLGIFALLILIRRYGFPQFVAPPALTLLASAILTTGLFLEAFYRLLWVRDPWRYLLQHPWRYLLLLVIVLELAGVAAWRTAAQDGAAPGVRVSQIYLTILLFGFISNWAKGVLITNRWLANRQIPVLALPAITFATAIMIGAAALSLPGLQRHSLSFLDNLFTSVSALCVTGLAVYDIHTALTPVGQVVLALLIQLGGLGTMSVMGWLALWQRGSITSGERIALKELVGGTGLGETRRLLRAILTVTLVVEALGAFVFWLLWRPAHDHAALKAVFHSISAFCNAGFALFSDSFASFRNDSATLFMLMILIFLGSAGFPVVANLFSVSKSRLLPWRENLHLQPASRLVLLWSAGLIVAGTLLFWIDGWLHNTPRTLFQAMFQSVSTRTAGFQVESQLRFQNLGLLVTIILMAIGAAPQSTGGGLKTTVVARLFRQMSPREAEASTPGLITFKPFRIALLLIVLYVLTAVCAAFFLMLTDRLAFTDASFESFSALGTVGLSRDVTPKLSSAGKWIAIALMFTGRVLYPTLVMWMVRGRDFDDPVPWA